MTENTPQPLPGHWASRFITIWIGQAFSLFGSSIVQFALVWYLTRKTGSATVLATATLFALLPQILLGPLAGTFVDRSNRRLVMILADGVIALATLGLILLFWSGRVEIWHIYVIMVIRSLGSAFHQPAMQASTSLMVPEKHLGRVAGANQALGGIMNVVAPPTGAVLIGLFSMQQVLLVDVVTAGFAIFFLTLISIPQPVRMAAQAGMPKPSFLEDFREGFRYVAAWPGLLAILIMASLLNFLLNPAGSLTPLLVTKHFGLGAIEYGWMDSLFGLGFITGGIFLSVWGGFRRKIVTSMLAIIGIGLGVLVIGLAPANLFGVALGGMLMMGFMNPLANGPLFAVVQSSVRPDMQGRVMSLIMSVAMIMSPLSLLVAGPIADTLGIQVWYWLGGGVCLLIGISAFFIPVIMNVESNRSEAGPAAVPVVK